MKANNIRQYVRRLQTESKNAEKYEPFTAGRWSTIADFPPYAVTMRDRSPDYTRRATIDIGGRPVALLRGKGSAFSHMVIETSKKGIFDQVPVTGLSLCDVLRVVEEYRNPDETTTKKEEEPMQTVAQIEKDAEAGKPISLSDLAAALQNEKPEPKPARVPVLPPPVPAGIVIGPAVVVAPKPEAPKAEPVKPEFMWAEYLKTAITEPGLIDSCYEQFHDYSFGNIFAAACQCRSRGLQFGPIGTFKHWLDAGRYVRKGEKALLLCRPFTITRKEKDVKTGEDKTESFTRFTWEKRWFVLSQTDGQDYKPAEKIGQWEYKKALDVLQIKETAFDAASGNVQGFARRGKNEIAINPVAAHATRTALHEIAHIVLGHTSPDNKLSRPVKELEAEATAYIICKALAYEDGKDAESRGYIQNWWTEKEIPERSARAIFKAVDTILKAGLPDRAKAEDAAA